MRHPILELRRYTLHPGQRDVLIDLFDREFVESQEAAGMAVVGQFRDLDDPDRFVWLRGFSDMPRRAEALSRFYGGPVWRAHREAANATMVESDDVLLLRPVGPHTGFPAPADRPPPGPAAPPSSAVLATIYHRDQPFDAAFAASFDRDVRPALATAGVTPLACLQTEYAENTFPALPVRTDVHAFVWLARFPSVAGLDQFLGGFADPAMSTVPTVERLRLTPTARSALR